MSLRDCNFIKHLNVDLAETSSNAFLRCLLMRVVPLDSVLEPLFWEYVNQDIPDCYFFILDMRRDRASTEIRLALNKQNRIEGLMMIYRKSIVQLRGSPEAGRVLLERLDLEEAKIQAPSNHKTLILKRFKNVKRTFDLIQMTLRKGEENLSMKHPIVRLSGSEVEDIAALMRRENPEWWGGITAEQIAKRMTESLWLRIKVDGRLVSVGSATIDDWASNVGTVVTHESYRNRGYATSIVSALVEKILQKSNIALIHVESGNLPAIKVYTKVGFKPYKRYFVAEVEK